MSDQAFDEQAPIDYGEVVGRSFLDKLLLAIIDGHPEPSKSPASDTKRRKDRLREAKQALLGKSHTEGRPLESDEAVLRWMGSEHYRDRARHDMAKLNGKAATKIRSDRKLAEQAVSRFGLPSNATERLRAKFGKEKQKWLDIEIHHDDVPEQLDFNTLQVIQKTLARHGTAMILDRIER